MCGTPTPYCISLKICSIAAGLAALGRGRLAAATTVFSDAIAAYLGVPNDHPTATITMSTLAAALGAYINAIVEHEPTRELHDWLINFLRAMLGSTPNLV